MTDRRTDGSHCCVPSMKGRRIVAVALLLLSLAFPSLAAAQTSSEALAESLFIEARKLIADGNFAAACPKLRQSHELDPQLGTLLNLGKCYEQNGQTASAWATFAELSRLAKRAGQKARAEYAAERVGALEPTLAYVTVRLTAPAPDVTVRIDDELLSNAVLGSALPLDPGTHQITVQAPYYEPWQHTLEVSPSSRQTIVVPALEPMLPEPSPVMPTPTVVPSPPPAPPPAPMPPRTVDDASSPWWTAAITGYVVAGAGVTVGAITGIIALDAGGSLDCSMGECPPSDADTLSRANTFANVANVSFAVAGAALIFAIVATALATDDDGAVSFRDGVVRF